MKGIRPAPVRIREALLCCHDFGTGDLCLQRANDHLHTPDPKCLNKGRHHAWAPDLAEVNRVRRELSDIAAEQGAA
jgi:hypothetical protein